MNENRQRFERILLSYCFKNQEYYFKLISEGVTKDYFSVIEFQEIWQRISDNALSLGITPLIIADQMNFNSENEKTGYIEKLERLKEEEFVVDDFFYSIRSLKEIQSHLALQELSVQINNSISSKVSSQDIISNIMLKIFSIGSENDNIQESNAEKALKDTGQEIGNRLKGEVVDGVPSGIKTLDNEINCFYYGLYSLIIARPGHCKTTLMINAFVNNIKAGFRPVFISLEMPAVHLMIKVIAIWTKIDVSKIMNPKLLSEDELDTLRKAMDEIKKYDFYIVDAVSMSVTECAIYLYKYSKLGCNSAYLDYFQLLKLPNGDMPSDASDFMTISKLMRQYIKNVNRVGNMALIMGAQAGRDVEKRPIEDRVPQMSDLQWSSSLEQDAAVVIGLMNREKYEGDSCEYPNQLFVGFPKHRYQNAIRINLAFLGSIQYITDLAHPERVEIPLKPQ